MAIIEGGVSATLADVGAAAAKGLHTINKPLDAGALGHYVVAVETGSIAAGAGADSEIFQFRWTDATRLAVILGLQADYLYATTGFTAGLGTLRSTIARAFTAAGTGGTTLTLSGNNNKLRTSMGSSLVGEIRVASTAALGAGTKTFDVNDVGRYKDAIAATTNANLLANKPLVLWNCDQANAEHPIVLAQNEGLVVRATVPATGVWIAGLTLWWAEVALF